MEPDEDGPNDALRRGQDQDRDRVCVTSCKSIILVYDDDADDAE